MAVTVTRRGLRVGETDVPLILGAMHYWRLDPALWPDLLDKVAAMGFGMVETYIPWGVHETARGRFDFGDGDPRKDLDRFLSLCRDRRMWVLVRPGPHINAELTCFGYPERVLADPACQAVSAQGTPVILPFPPRAFPVPSYASEAFYHEVSVWFDAVCPIIVRHLHPRGTVVAVQADNEMSNFFRTNAYDLDYSGGSADLYRWFIREKYGDIGALNVAYGTRHRDFVEIPLPRRFDARDRRDLPYYLDWAQYKEFYLLYGLSRIRGMLEDRGIADVPVTHNYPTPEAVTPFNIPAVEREIDIQGFDMYPRASEYQALKRGCLTVGAQSRLPFVPEFGAGCWLWFPPIMFSDQQFVTLVPWMHGVRAMSYYMLVERERWYGSPILRDGRVREESADFYRRLNRALARVGLLECEHQAGVLLARPRSYQRLERASTLLEPASTILLRILGMSPEIECSEERFGFRRPIQIAAGDLLRAWMHSLASAQYAFHIGDTDMTVEALGRYPLLIAPTYEFLGRSEQECLLGYARAGGVLVIGPEVPATDERMAPCGILGDALAATGQDVEGLPGARIYAAGRGKIIVSDGPPRQGFNGSGAVDALARIAGVVQRFPSSDPEVETSYHAAPSGDRGVLFVANPTGAARRVSVFGGRRREFRDAWPGTAEGTVTADRLDLEMSPFSVRMLEVR